MKILTPNSVPLRLGKTVGAALLLTMASFADDVRFSFDPKAVPGTVRAFIVLSVMVFWLILAVGVLVSILKFDWRPLITRAIVLVFSVLLVSSGMTAAAFIHLIVMYPHYHAKIAGRTGPINFDWGTTECFEGFPGPSMKYSWILIYDTTGETAMKAKTENHYHEETTHLLGGFFVKAEDWFGC